MRADAASIAPPVRGDDYNPGRRICDRISFGGVAEAMANGSFGQGGELGIGGVRTATEFRVAWRLTATATSGIGALLETSIIFYLLQKDIVNDLK